MATNKGVAWPDGEDKAIRVLYDKQQSQSQTGTTGKDGK